MTTPFMKMFYGGSDLIFEISKDIGVSYNTVALWIRRYEETGNTDNSVRPSLISTMQGCQLHALSSYYLPETFVRFV